MLRRTLVFGALLGLLTGTTLLRAQQPQPATSQPATSVSNGDETNIRIELATIVEDAAIPQRFDQLLNQFSRLDRAVAHDTPATQSVASPTLQSGIADFQRAWKEKYHEDFNLRANQAKVFNQAFATINVGDFGDA